MMLNQCVKSVQIRSYFWSGLNTEKYRPEITPYLHTFYAMEHDQNLMRSQNSCLFSSSWSITIFCRPRRLEDVLKRFSWRLGRERVVTLKASSTCFHQGEFLLGYNFFFFWDIAKQCHEKFVFILVAVIVVVSVFQLYLSIGVSF